MPDVAADAKHVKGDLKQGAMLTTAIISLTRASPH